MHQEGEVLHVPRVYLPYFEYIKCDIHYIIAYMRENGAEVEALLTDLSQKTLSRSKMP